VKRLPVKAVQLPILALSSALTTMDLLRREYDDLAERGELLVARLRGEVVERADEIEDRVGDLVDGSLAGANGRLQDALDQAASFAPDRDEVKDAVTAPAGFASADPAPSTAATPATAGTTGTVGTDPEAPKGVPTPKATEPDSTRIDTAASPSVVAAVEQAVEAVEAASNGPVGPVSHDELPLPDYDHMTLGSLRGRMRSLSLEQLVAVRTYEKAHADRLPIVTMLDNRIAKLSAAPVTPASPA
jgi:hypothetical protein